MNHQATTPRATLVALLAAISIACGGEPPGLEPVPPAAPTNVPAPSAAAAAQERVRVATVIVEPRPLAEEIVLTGELRADESVALRSRAEGHVVALHFKEGQAVERGALLVEIDDAQLRAERRRVAVQRDFAEKRARRAQALFDQATISRELYEESAGPLAELEARLGEIDARIAQTELRAPFAGIIGLRQVSVGSYLTSAVTVATLQAIDPIKVDLAAPERYAQRIRPGHRIAFDIAGLEGSFEGTVYAVEPRIDSETRTLRLRARAANPGGRLLPGAFARVRLVLGTAEEALMVPSIALVPGLETTTVYVAEDGIARARAVRTGVRTAEQVEIVDGLAAGDRVIVSGLHQVEPGTAVESLP